jgi:hypothetical protein
MPYRIDYQKDHKNVKGKSAPWVIINEDRDEIVGSSGDKETADGGTGKHSKVVQPG